MSKFESAPNLNSSEANSAETEAGVNATKKSEGEFAPEELEKLKAEEGQEQEPEKPGLSPEEQIKNLKEESEIRQQEIAKLTESIEDTKAKLNETRKQLGLPPIEEEPPSIFSQRDRLERLRAEQGFLEKQREELVSRQEKEQLVYAGKEIPPEIKKEAEKFDQELNEITKKQIESGKLTSEQAEMILKQAEVLKVEDKAELAEEIKKEENLKPGQREEKENTVKEFHETVSQYELAIDNLVERANALGIEISAEALKTHLESLKNVDPEAEEQMTWVEFFNDHFRSLEKQIKNLERTNREGKLTPEKRAEAQKDLSKSFEKLTEKIVEYTVRLTLAIAKGIIKGIIKAFRKG